MNESIVRVALPQRANIQLLLHMVQLMLPGAYCTVGYHDYQLFIIQQDWEPPRHASNLTWEQAIVSVITKIKKEFCIQKDLSVGFFSCTKNVTV